MATAQLTSRVELDLLRGGAFPGERKAVETRSGARAERSAGGGLPAGIVQAVTDRMERGDTLPDKLAGYGLCGLTMFYLTAHMVRAVF